MGCKDSAFFPTKSTFFSLMKRLSGRGYEALFNGADILFKTRADSFNLIADI